MDFFEATKYLKINTPNIEILKSNYLLLNNKLNVGQKLQNYNCNRVYIITKGFDFRRIDQDMIEVCKRSKHLEHIRDVLKNSPQFLERNKYYEFYKLNQIYNVKEIVKLMLNSFEFKCELNQISFSGCYKK